MGKVHSVERPLNTGNIFFQIAVQPCCNAATMLHCKLELKVLLGALPSVLQVAET